VNARLEMVCTGPDGVELRKAVLTIERQELAMETLGLTLAEGKVLLQGVQDFLIEQQVADNLEQHRTCSSCGQRHISKDGGTTSVKTLFGTVQVPNPRWNRCGCQTEGPKTFRPTTAWLKGVRVRRCSIWKRAGPR
jgi:hypothetical protein